VTTRAWVTALALCATACQGSRVAVTEENDLLSRGTATDRDYTQGARVEVARPLAAASAPERALFATFDRIPLLLPAAVAGQPAAGALTWSLRQRIFTPENLETDQYQPDDRPYAGLLDFTVARTRVWLDPDPSTRRDRLQRVSLSAGAMGSASLARDTQIGYHDGIGEPRPNGWRHQVPTEATLGLEVLSRQRFFFATLQPGRAGGFEFDAALERDLRLGNADTSLGTAFLLRLGAHLPRAEGLFPHGTAIDPVSSAWIYLRAGARGVFWDATLDGALFADSPSVERENVVGTAELGGVLLLRGFAVSYGIVISTPQFEGQGRVPTYGRLVVGPTSLW